MVRSALAETLKIMPVPVYRLLALDVDGTLLNTRHEISVATHQAVRQARAVGIEVLLVTGRRYGKTYGLARDLGLPTPVVSAGGALIKHPGENHRTWYVAEFPRDVLQRLFAEIAAAGFEPALYGDTFEAGFDFYAPRLEVEQPEFAEYLTKNAGLGKAAPDWVENPPPALMACFVMGTRKQMHDLADRLNAALPEALYVHVLRSPLYNGWMCEVAPAGVTKWSGLRRLADAWNIPPERICAVGDDVNDLPMVVGAGFGVAMGNGVPELRAAADWVAPRNDEEGIAAVVRRLIHEFVE